MEELKIILELDGEQHFGIQIGHWKSPEHNRNRDIYKTKCARENEYSMIRIIQEDVWKDKFNWLEELVTAIEKVVNEKITQVVYICKNNEYANFDMPL